MIFLDTHVVAWLYAYGADKLSPRARDIIERDPHILISPIVLLALDFLFEIGRLRLPSQPAFEYLSDRLGVQTSNKPFLDVIRAASRLTWTRDPFDRIIVAQAPLTSTVLVTKDATISKHYDYALW